MPALVHLYQVLRLNVQIEDREPGKTPAETEITEELVRNKSVTVSPGRPVQETPERGYFALSDPDVGDGPSPIFQNQNGRQVETPFGFRFDGHCYSLVCLD